MFRLLAGMLTPLRFSGALYLRAELRKHRPGQPDLPSALIDEIIGTVLLDVEIARIPRLHRPDYVVRSAEHHARELAAVLGKPAWLAPGVNNYHLEILRRHGLA